VLLYASEENIIRAFFDVAFVTVGQRFAPWRKKRANEENDRWVKGLQISHLLDTKGRDRVRVF
jgi:hypothetical protein